MKEKLVKALMVEPYKHPCVVELECDLDSLQKAVFPSRGLLSSSVLKI